MTVDSGKTLNVVFTDSGLGGLSVMAHFYNLLKNKRRNKQSPAINLVFFNALPESGRGYNRMRDASEKAQIFNKTLNAMQRIHKPAVIAIACNTLSAVYPQTDFAKQSTTTFEIISVGRKMIRGHRASERHIPIFVLATPTTVESKAYAFDDTGVTVLDAGSLASEIERSADGQGVQVILDELLASIKEQVGNSPLVLFLGCTHYGYIKDLILEKALSAGIKVKAILNPNDTFAQDLFNWFLFSHPGCYLSNSPLLVQSQAKLEDVEITSISHLLHNQSPELSGALQNYSLLDKAFQAFF